MRCLCECESLAAPKHRVPGELQRRHTQHIAAMPMQSIQLPAARSPLSPPTASTPYSPPSAPPPPPHRCRNHNMYMFRANRKFRASAASSSSSPRMPCAFRSRILCVCVSVRAWVSVYVCEPLRAGAQRWCCRNAVHTNANTTNGLHAGSQRQISNRESVRRCLCR